jgi:3-oxoacyl-[acyl-carrier protein] reductase
MSFAGRVVLVTGAAQGIGRAIAAGFRQAGARVHVADRDAGGLAANAQALDCMPHVVDLADRAAAHDLLADVIRSDGRIDVLALAAGGVCGQIGRPIEEVDETSWRAIQAANVEAALWLAQAAAPQMKRAAHGRIVTVSSGAGLRPSLTGIQAYTAAKHALIGLTRQLSFELGRHGITVNSVAPGFVPSNPASVRQWESYGADGQAALISSIHTGRLGTPEDIANAVLFFAADASGWISGQVLSVDGGRS